MSNMEVVKEALLQRYSLVTVERFILYASLDRQLSMLIERNPQKAIALCLEVLRIATGNDN